MRSAVDGNLVRPGPSSEIPKANPSSSNGEGLCDQKGNEILIGQYRYRKDQIIHNPDKADLLF